MTAAIAVLLASWLVTDEPEYPGAVLSQVGNDWAVAGQRSRVGYFMTDDEPAQVARFYARRWRARGLPVIADSEGDSGGTVSTFFTREGLQQSVVIRRHGQRTLAFKVVRELGPEMALPWDAQTWGAENALFQEGPEQDARQRSTLIALPLAAAASQLKDAMNTRGYRLVHESERSDGLRKQRMLQHVHDKDEVFSTLSSLGPNTSAMAQTVMVTP